jgi:hypothetical protein
MEKSIFQELKAYAIDSTFRLACARDHHNSNVRTYAPLIVVGPVTGSFAFKNN